MASLLEQPKTLAECDKRLVLLSSERQAAFIGGADDRVELLTGEIDDALEQRSKLTQLAALASSAGC